MISLEGLTVTNNALLPTCQVTALATRAGVYPYTNGNDDISTCP